MTTIKTYTQSDLEGLTNYRITDASGSRQPEWLFESSCLKSKMFKYGGSALAVCLEESEGLVPIEITIHKDKVGQYQLEGLLIFCLKDVELEGGRIDLVSRREKQFVSTTGQEWYISHLVPKD